MRRWGILAASLMAGSGFGLTLDEAVSIGLENNGALVQRLLDARQAATEWVRAGGVYDTELTANLFYTDTELSSPGSPIDSASKTLHGDAGIQRRFSTGTSVGIGLESDHVRFSESEFADENNQTVFTLSLSQSLLRNAFGRQQDAEIRAAEARYQSAWLQYLDERDAVAQEIHRAFWNAYNEFFQFQISQRSLNRSEELLDVNTRREKDGLLDETDVLAAEAALASQTVNVIALQDAYITAREQLLSLIRFPMSSWEETTLDFDVSLRSAPANLVEDAGALYDAARNQQEVFQSLDALARAAEERLAAAEQALKPELNVFGRFGVGDVDEDYPESWGTGRTQWTIGLEFSTTWDRSAERSLRDQAELELESIEEQMIQAEQDLFLACRVTTRDIGTLEARRDAAKLARDLHQRKLDLEMVKFEQGRSETSRIIDYQDDVEFAEGEVVAAEAAYRTRAAEMLRLMGILSGENPAVPDGVEGQP